MVSVPTSSQSNVIEPRLVAQLCDVAIRAAHSVRDDLLSAFRSPMDTGTKVDFHDIVTIHDRRAEESLKSFIFREIPDSRVLGEEGGRQGDGRIEWYIDPIDGTANFACGLAFWCVSIAAVIDGEIVAGVVFDPVSGNTFSADAGGAWLNGQPLNCRAHSAESEAVVITGYPVARDFRFDGRQRALDNFAMLAERFSTVRRPGSAALSLCHVAAGWADAAMGFGVNAWDVCAAILILRRAGGTYTPYRLGKVPAGAPDFLAPGYVGTGKGARYPTLDAIATAISAHREILAVSSSN